MAVTISKAETMRALENLVDQMEQANGVVNVSEAEQTDFDLLVSRMVMSYYASIPSYESKLTSDDPRESLRTIEKIISNFSDALFTVSQEMKYK